MDNGSDRVADEENLSDNSEIRNVSNSECVLNQEAEEAIQNRPQAIPSIITENNCESLPRIYIRKRTRPYRENTASINSLSSTADYASTSSGVSSSFAMSQESLSNNEDNGEPSAKRRSMNREATNDDDVCSARPEQRSISPFVGFFSCVICREVPHTSIYQCRNGHLMCNTCSTRYLAEHTMSNATPRCPCCRVSISRNSLFRNLAVENALIVFPEKCTVCNQQFDRNNLEYHKTKECIERSSICKYARVGCDWQGPFRLLSEHEKDCIQSKKTVAEVMSQLDKHLTKLENEHLPYQCLKDLVNVSRCFCLDMESRLYYSDRHIHMAYFGTRTFNAFGHQWAVKIRVNEQQQQADDNSATTFKLQLKTRPLDTFRINFFILNGPFSTTKFNLKVYCYDFNFRRLDSDYFVLPMIDSQESYRMLANRKINFRVFMFLKGAQ